MFVSASFQREGDGLGRPAEQRVGDGIWEPAAESTHFGRSSANADALTLAGFLDRGRETGLATDGRSTVTVSAIVFVPVASL